MTTRLPVALILSAALLVAAPATSPADSASAAKKSCTKAKAKKRCKPVKKKAASNVPADGIYNSGDGALNLAVATRAGKRTVTVRVRIPLTCTPSGETQPRTLSILNLPLAGSAFSGKSDQDPSYGFGETTVSGAFLSATRVHVAAQNANYKNGTDVCGGSVDVTANIKKGY
jgi:hypothetical protein